MHLLLGTGLRQHCVLSSSSLLQGRLLLMQAMGPQQQHLDLGPDLCRLQSASASFLCALRRELASVLLQPAASDLNDLEPLVAGTLQGVCL